MTKNSPNLSPEHQNDLKRKLLVRIILGAAWADGKLEPAELDYLHKILQPQDLEQDEEVQALLKEPPSSYQQELWIVQYLGCTDVPERLGALAQVANLLMSDGEVSTVEHDFLDEIHTLMTQIPPQEKAVEQETTQNILASLGKIVGKMVKSVHKNQ